jgi:hypothetical protein
VLNGPSCWASLLLLGKFIKSFIDQVKLYHETLFHAITKNVFIAETIIKRFFGNHSRPVPQKHLYHMVYKNQKIIEINRTRAASASKNRWKCESLSYIALTTELEHFMYRHAAAILLIIYARE